MPLYNRIIISCIFIAIFSTGIGFLPLLSLILLCAIFGMIVVINNRKFLNKRKNVFFRKSAIIYLIILILNSFNSYAGNNIFMNFYVSAEFLISFILLDIMLDHQYDKKTISYFATLILIYALIAFLIAVVKEEFKQYSFIFSNKNIFGATLLFLYVPLILVSNKWGKYKYYLVNFLYLFLLFISGARSCFIVFGGFLLIKTFLKTLFLKYFKYYFCVSIVLSIVFILLYININTIEYFEFFNEISIEQTGSRLASGRNVIWERAIDFLFNNNYYIFGIGSGAQQSNIEIDINLSLHNLYLQIFMQNGIIGLTSFLVFIYSFFITIRKKIGSNSSNQDMFLFIFLLFIHQNFEVMLFQNNMLFVFILSFLLPLFNDEKNKIT